MAPPTPSLYVAPPPPRLRANANELHAVELAIAGFNRRLAVKITQASGTMLCAYLFAVLALVGLVGIVGGLPPIMVVLVTWFSQTFLQLVFLPVLSVGNATISRKAEIQTDQQFADVENLLHAAAAMQEHLDAQDAEILRIQHLLLEQKGQSAWPPSPAN